LKYKFFAVLTFLLLIGSASSFAQEKDNISIGFSDTDYGHLTLKEWKRFKDFKTKLKISQSSIKEKEESLKGYTRDSLQILQVKLLAIKILEEEKLLNHDIAENPKYYTSLLQELKESDIKRSEYLFLENKLAFLTTETATDNLWKSLSLNVVLMVILVFVLIGVFRLKGQRKDRSISLSRQETNIRNLILEGKSNKEIANELFISLSTVKTHITSIYSKLGVSGRNGLFQKHTGTST